MSRKTPKSKSTTTANASTTPKSKASSKPKSKSKPKSGPSRGGKPKRASSNISVAHLAERVTALENGSSAFRDELKTLITEINIISEWIKEKFGIELINKSSEIYKYIHDSKNELPKLTKKLSAVSPTKKCNKINIGESSESKSSKQDQDRAKDTKEVSVALKDQQDHDEIKINADEQNQSSDNNDSNNQDTKAEANNNEDKHEKPKVNAEGENNSSPIAAAATASTAAITEPSSSHSSSNANVDPSPIAAPDSPPPAPRPLTSFEKSRLALYQRTLQERRKSNAAAAAAAAGSKSKESRPKDRLAPAVSPPPPKITRIDAEPETTSNQSISHDDDGDSEPPQLDHSGTDPGPGGHFLEIIPSPGTGRLQKRGRCVICSKKKIERKSRFWCGLCKKSLCQSPCYEEYHRSGAAASD